MGEGMATAETSWTAPGNHTAGDLKIVDDTIRA